MHYFDSKLWVKGEFFHISHNNEHAPTDDAEEEMKEVFYDKLTEMYDNAPEYNVKIVLGDMNAKVERENTFQSTISQESLHMEWNNNGYR